MELEVYQSEDISRRSIEDLGSSTPSSVSSPQFLPPTASTSATICVVHVDLTLLGSVTAQMAKFHNKNMHIPEPYAVVRAQFYYLYTDSVAAYLDCPPLDCVAGHFEMANVYDMARGCLLCLYRLSREVDVEHAAVV